MFAPIEPSHMPVSGCESASAAPASDYSYLVDLDRERFIEDCNVVMTRLFAEGEREAAYEVMKQRTAAIKARSPAAQARIEARVQESLAFFHTPYERHQGMLHARGLASA